jgi:hypothetical protein
MVLAVCAVGIGFVVRGERNKSLSPIGAAQAAAAE